MNQNELFAIVFVALLFLGMLVSLEIGRRLALRAAPGTGDKEGLGVIDGAIFALLGLLVAFTFSGAAARFEERRHLIVEEANDIGTAYLRIDLLPAEAQPEIRDLFRQYVDARLAIYRDVRDLDIVRSRMTRSQELQGEIWSKSVAASKQTNPTTASMLLLPALNAMFDITTVRLGATENHPAESDFCHAGSDCVGQFADGWIRDGWRQTSQLAAHFGICSHTVHRRLCNSRSRVSTLGTDSRRCLRSLPGGCAQFDEVTVATPRPSTQVVLPAKTHAIGSLSCSTGKSSLTTQGSSRSPRTGI